MFCNSKFKFSLKILLSTRNFSALSGFINLIVLLSYIADISIFPYKFIFLFNSVTSVDLTKFELSYK